MSGAAGGVYEAVARGIAIQEVGGPVIEGESVFVMCNLTRAWVSDFSVHAYDLFFTAAADFAAGVDMVTGAFSVPSVTIEPVVIGFIDERP